MKQFNLSLILIVLLLSFIANYSWADVDEGVRAIGSGDYAKAMKIFKADGSAVAQLNIGVMYLQGQGVRKDMREANKWFLKAAIRGNTQAQNNIAYSYLEGIGIQKDEREAVKWFRKAAEQGDSQAQANLGGCYLLGRGIIIDIQEAKKWFRKAAEQGNKYGEKGLQMVEEAEKAVKN